MTIEKHVIQRGLERHGVRLGRGASKEMGRLIRQAHPATARFLRSRTNRAKEWAVFFRGQWLPVLYCTQRHVVVTILPPSHLDDFTTEMP
jgi:hypothetical protein